MGNETGIGVRGNRRLAGQEITAIYMPFVGKGNTYDSLQPAVYGCTAMQCNGASKSGISGIKIKPHGLIKDCTAESAGLNGDEFIALTVPAKSGITCSDND